MAWYKTGTITVTNGSVTVSGAGTAWISNAAVGEALYAPDGKLYEITNIASDTTMTIAPAYLGATASAQPYVIVPSQSYIRDLAAQAADLVNNYSTIYNTVGQGKFGDGTLAAPGIRFSDDLDTGFFRSASNEVTFVAGGTAIFKYSLTGGLSLTTGGALVGTTATQTLTNKTLTAPIISGTMSQNGGYVNLGSFNSGATGTTPNESGMAFGGNITNGFAEQDIWNTANPSTFANTGILFTQRLTASTRRDLMFMHNNGNVGIGTITPLSRLNVSQSSTNTANYYDGASLTITNSSATANNFDTLRFTTANGNDAAAIWAIVKSHTTGAATGALLFGTTNASSAATERMRISEDGRVSIGTGATYSASTRLEVVAGGDTAIAARAGTTATQSEIGARTSDFSSVFTNTSLVQYGSAKTGTTAGISNGSLGILQFINCSTGLIQTNSSASIAVATNGTERARFPTAGGFVVGGTTHLNGTGISNYGSFTVVRNTGATAGKYWNTPYIDVNNSCYIINNSNTGVVITDGATSWSANSDERLKDIIEPIANAAEKVASLRAVIGKYKTDDADKRRSFLIAQDVEKVLPEAITRSTLANSEDETEYLNVAYTDVIPLLVAAIKELKAEIDALKAAA